MTKVRFNAISSRNIGVEIDRLGLVGAINQWNKEPWKFRYTGDAWMQMTYDENTAVLAAAKKKELQLNVIRRLTT